MRIFGFKAILTEILHMKDEDEIALVGFSHSYNKKICYLYSLLLLKYYYCSKHFYAPTLNRFQK